MEYKSCRFIEHGLYFKYNAEGSISLKHCCNMDAAPECEQALLQKVRNLDDVDWDKVLSEKRILRENAKKGIYHPLCEKCWELTTKEWDNEDYFSELTFAHIMRCNSRCVYCFFGTHEELYNSKQMFVLLPLIKELISKKLIRFTGSLRYMGGEPTLMSDFEEITNLFVENNINEIYLPTSGIKYSKAVENACKKVPKCEIFISIDSGCRETYQKIKRVNAYNLVLKSLKNYSKNRKNRGENIISKFIVFPGYNDNTAEIDKWVNESKKSGIKYLSPDVEMTYATQKEKQRYWKHIYNIIKYAKKKIRENNLNCIEVVYLKMVKQWVAENKDKFENDTSDLTCDLNVSDKTIQEIKNEISSIITANNIFNKPVLNLKSQTEITEIDNFEEILYECVLNGFTIILSTNGRRKSLMIEEALKIANIKINVEKKGKFSKHYQKICPDKVIITG